MQGRNTVFQGSFDHTWAKSLCVNYCGMQWHRGTFCVTRALLKGLWQRNSQLCISGSEKSVNSMRKLYLKASTFPGQKYNFPRGPQHQKWWRKNIWPSCLLLCPTAVWGMDGFQHAQSWFSSVLRRIMYTDDGNRTQAGSPGLSSPSSQSGQRVILFLANSKVFPFKCWRGKLQVFHPYSSTGQKSAKQFLKE